MRHQGEKNQNYYHSHHTDSFNSIINVFNLREIIMSGGKYTWTNCQEMPTLVKLDRVLMSPKWEDLFPLVAVRKLAKSLSDHNALLLTSGSASANKPKGFRFELSWLQNEDFLPKLQEIWSHPMKAKTIIDIIHIKLQRCRKKNLVILKTEERLAS